MDLSPGAFLASLVVSSMGFGLFVYGKKQVRFPQLVVGLVMMIYPSFLGDGLAVWGLGGALVGGLVLAVRAGL